MVDLADLASTKEKIAIRVLHVDDDSSLQEITKLMLLDLDSSFEFDNAFCVDEGLSKLAAKQYDVVVSDYEMPQKSGLQFLKELREQKNNIPFVLFTGKGREEVAVEALNLGADGYYNKQGSPETVYGELAHGIRLSVERKKTEEALRQEQDKLEQATAAAGAGLVIVSKDYHVTWANDFIKRYKGDTIGKLCYATLNSLDAPCPDCGVAKIFAGKTTIDAHEYCSTTIDGKLFWVEIVATPITDEKGNVISAVEVAVDITERKKADEKLGEIIRNNELVNEKLRVVGGLTRHDVGNKLSVIGSNEYLLRKRLGDKPELVKYLDRIESAIDSSNRIFEFSRFYEKIGSEKPSAENVFDCFNQAVALMPNLGKV
ncbi:response regulator, partial [Candidatus Bathyarchaeota archaeon]|nr:response regulator [Candidatus Bathyarchaeota archaeon]